MTTPQAISASHPAGVRAPNGTGSSVSRVLGVVALAAMGLLVWLAFVASPRDAIQGDLVRLLFLHPALAWTAYLACFIATAASIQHLRKGTVGSDILAHSAVELGAVMTLLTLVTGSVWGRPTWGVWWVWDARLTSTAMLFLLLLGYLALHRIDAAPEVRSKRSAVLGVLLVPNVLLVHQSVEWWRTLHQDATLLDRQFDFGTSDLFMFTMIFGFVAVTLVFSWLLLHRFRVGWLEHQVESEWLDEAIEARRAEAHAESHDGTPTTGGVAR
ncbi:MAG: cytochrome c biogenesis protein CcsA [Acidimicrobiia bacterium]|nr:cytochrome c biogenesis protein CcsA [Acidimicrobiia bacterium]